MPARIFINYRRDDARDMAARLRDRLAAEFGPNTVFMDVNDLKAGQRFDKELEKALVDTDIFVSVIGPRWMELFDARKAAGERDFVREEIAGALKGGVVVVPVLLERTPLPRKEDLTEDIADLVFHHKLEVSHERFTRDTDELIDSIKAARKGQTSGTGSSSRFAVVPALAAGLAALAVAVGAILYATGVLQPATIAARISETAPTTSRPTGARDCADCPEMVRVPAGSITMGSTASDTEKPPHAITIRAPFEVGKFAVTFAEWDACAAGGGCTGNPRPSDEGWGRGRRPVINVSWSDAKEYIAWLNGRTGKVYRLLSEAEWEYAARAGAETVFHWGDRVGQGNANCDGCGSAWDGKSTAPVGSFKPNAFGLYDMHGNVWQWVEDTWNPNHRDAPSTGSVRAGGDPSAHVARGGAWGLASDVLRASIRRRVNIQARSGDIGFRIGRTGVTEP